MNQDTVSKRESERWKMGKSLRGYSPPPKDRCGVFDERNALGLRKARRAGILQQHTRHLGARGFIHSVKVLNASRAMCEKAQASAFQPAYARSIRRCFFPPCETKKESIE